MGLRNKFLLHISIVVALTMSGVLAVVVARQSQLLSEEARKRGLTIARQSAAGMSSSLLIFDKVELQQDVTEISEMDDVTFVAIFDKNAEHPWAFDSQFGIKAEEEIEPPIDGPIADPCRERRGVFGGHHILDITTPVYYHDQSGKRLRIGSIRMGLSLDDIDANIAVTRGRVLLLWGVALAVGFLTSSVLARRITRPIEDLVRAATRYAKGDFGHRIAVSGSDEIGTLGRTLDTMSSEIQGRTEKLRKALIQAEAANHAKSEFLANISHELRTPLHCILSFSRFGKNRATEKLLEFFGRIEESGQSLLGLVDNLLDLAACEAGEMSLRLEPVNFDSVILRAIGEVSALLHERELTVHDDRAGDEEPYVAADMEKLMQVARNLLGNAVRYSQDGGSIEISRISRAHSVVVTVRDRGPGIPEAELDTIFDKFVQSSTTKTGAGGTGLGLAICREIVSAHQGRIWAENAPEGGAKFCVELPRLSKETAKLSSTDDTLCRT